MAVNVTKSGGIYIEISGDFSQLQKDLRAVQDLSKIAGADISKALGDAIDPRRVSSSISSLTQSLMKAQSAGKALSADFSSQADKLREWGQAVGIADKQLEHYVALQAKALKTQSTKAYVSEMRTLQRQTGMSDEELNALSKTLGGTGQEFTKAAKSARELCLNMTTLYIEAAKVAALKAIWDGFKGAFDLAARYETLGVVVHQVGKVAGYSAVQVDANVSSLRRMGIAGVEARKTLTQLMQAQVDIAKAPGLARVAQDAAVIGGTNSSEAFETMVHGIQSAQTEVLRTIGINVNFEQSYAKMAASLGKTTAELTEQEKTQARLNAVMEAGEKISGSYEAAMTTLGKQISSLTRIQNDFLTDFGKFSLEIAKASGGLKGYMAILEGWSGISLAARGKMAGLSLDELTQAGRGGGPQALRDLVEGAEAARNELESFAAQAAALAAQGIDVEPYVRDIAKLKHGVFDAREEIELLEKRISLFDAEGLDTSSMVSQLEALKQKAIEGAGGVNHLRRSIHEAIVLMRSMSNAPSADAPATLFTFKPYKPGSGVPADIRDIGKTQENLRAAYGKTADVMKQAKIATIKENKELVAALSTQGHMAKDEAAKLTKAFDKELESLIKGERTAGIASERTAFQAAESARAASDALKNLQLRHSELVAQIDGNSLGAALERSQRDYETQIDAIAKKEAEIAKNRALWAKEKKLTTEASASLDEQQKYLEKEKEVHKAIKAINDELARRADLARTYRANMDYAGLLGDLRAYYAEEVKLLELQMLSASEAERRSLAEKKRIAEARASLDIGGMFQTGMANMARESTQGVIDFWEKTLPNSIGQSSDAIGVAFAEIGLGTKSVSQSFADMGQSIQRVFQQIIADFINMSIRMAMFGKDGSGGALGSLVSGIGGLFGGGGSFGGAYSSGVVQTVPRAAMYGPSALGNVFSGGNISAYSGSIVTRPTLFSAGSQIKEYALGGGLMGEAGAEAIMPLRRGSGGRLGVDASGLGGAQQQAPQVNVIVNTPPGVGVAEQEKKPNGQGGFDMTILLEMVDKAMASGISSGRSKTAHAMSMRGM